MGGVKVKNNRMIFIYAALFTHPNLVPNLYDFLFPHDFQRGNLKNLADCCFSSIWLCGLNTLSFKKTQKHFIKIICALYSNSSEAKIDWLLSCLFFSLINNSLLHKNHQVLFICLFFCLGCNIAFHWNTTNTSFFSFYCNNAKCINIPSHVKTATYI